MAVKNLSQVWEQHTVCEFVTRDTEATLATMVDDAYVNHVPVLTGGYGKHALRTLRSRLHSEDAARYEAYTRFANCRRQPARRRNDFFFHPYGRDALDAAGSPTDEQTRRDPSGGDCAISRRQGRT